MVSIARLARVIGRRAHRPFDFHLLLPQALRSPQSLFYYSVNVAMFWPPWLVALLALLANFALTEHAENGVNKYITVRCTMKDIPIILLLMRDMVET